MVRVRRSAPRPPGARYAAASDGSFAGTISAGCVEADLREHILGLLRDDSDGQARIVSYGISDELAMSVGLACGGEIEVLIRRHDPDDPVWRELVSILDPDSGSRAHAALVTALSPHLLGHQLLIRPDGAIVGSLGDPALDGELKARVDQLFSREGSEVIELGSGHPVFVDRLLPRRRVVIVGATPVAAALAALASRVGYRVAVVEPREGLARQELLPGADVLVEWPDEAFNALDVNEWTDVAVLSHEGRLDQQALRAAIERGCRYVGLLGGKRTQRIRREALLASGVPASELERIHGPIGLDIGAVTPEEIAVSVLAEMLAVRRLGDPAR